MKVHTFLAVLFSLVGQRMAQSCGDGTDISLGLSQLTVYNVSIDAEEILKGPLYQLGNFDECLSTEGRQHCIAKVRLHIGDENSPFWAKKQALTADRTRVPRDELLVGLCVPDTCNSSSTEVALSKKLKHAANSLGIETTVYIEPSYCQKLEEGHATAGDYVMGFLSVLAVILLAVPTVYEASILMQKQGKIGNGFVVQFMMCFSLITNWKRLWTINNTSKSKPLRSIQGIRFITMYLIIAGHASYAMFITAHDNPEWIEEAYSDVTRALIFNGHLVVCSFFVIGGYLLGYMGMMEMEEDGFTLTLYLKAVVHRYARLTPAVAIIVAVAANWLKYFGTGPLWPFYGLIEVNNCNHHWWINLVYLQNYFYAERPCMLHLWYLAADFQNFLAFLLLLGFVYKHPQWAKTIFASALAVFIFIPFIQTYMEQLDPTVITIPRNFRNVTYNTAYLRNYVTFHHNAAPYLIGVIYGYAYYIVKVKAIKFSKAFVAFVWVVVLTVPWGIMMVGYFFYQPDYEYNVYIASIYAGFSKPLYAFGLGLILFACSLGIGWIANTVVSWKPFQVLGRLTFCSYLVHLLILEAEYSSVRRPLHISVNFIVRETVADVFISLLCGLALCLIVELPTSAILKLIDNYRPRERVSAVPKNNNDVTVPTISERTEELYKACSSERL